MAGIVMSVREAVERLRSYHRVIQDWGGVADMKIVFDAAMTSGDATLTVSDVGFSFTAADVGKSIYVKGAGVAGAGLRTTIAARISDTQATLAASASTTVSGEWVRFGTDNTAAIEQAISDLATKKRGGRLHFPRGGYYMSAGVDLSAIKAALRITGESWCSVSSYGNVTDALDNATVLFCAAAEPLFSVIGTSYSDACFCSNFERMTLSGVPESGSIGIRIVYGSDANMEHMMFDVFGDHAVKVESSINFTMDHSMAQNCMMVHTGRTAYVGVVDLDATDAFITRCNLNSDFNIVSDTPSVSGFIAGLVIRTANGWIRDCMLAQGEVGLVAINAGPLKLSQVRCDINRRHGFVILSGPTQINGCLAFRNSRDADNTYDGFYIQSGQNIITDCLVANLDQDNPGHVNPFTPARRQRWGFSDVGDFGENISLHNRYVNCRTVEVGSGTYNFTGATHKIMHVEYQAASGEQHPETAASVIRWQSTDGFLGLLKSTGIPYAALHIERDDSAIPLRLESATAAMLMKSTSAEADKGYWQMYVNAGGGFSELIGSVVNDAFNAAAQWLKVKRTMSVGVTAIDEVSFPPPVRAESTMRIDGVSTLRPSISGGAQVVAMHSSGVGIYVCDMSANPNAAIGGSGVVAGSLCFQAGSNVIWVFRDSGSWEQIYSGRELPEEGGSTNKKFLRSYGSIGSAGWAYVGTESMIGVNPLRYLRVAADGTIGEVTAQQVALDVRPYLEHHHFTAVSEPTGSGTTGSGGTPSHTHDVSVGVSPGSKESGDALWE